LIVGRNLRARLTARNLRGAVPSFKRNQAGVRMHILTIAWPKEASGTPSPIGRGLG